MDEDEIFPVLCPKKTYSKPFKKVARTFTESNNMEKCSRPSTMSNEPDVPLTTKVAVEYLLNGKLKTCVCRYCLKVTVGLSDLDQIMQIAGTGVMYKVSIREMIACFYPFKPREGEIFPEKICQKCLDRAINAYLFTQQCEQAERALHNCFDDIDEKFNKLDPLERPKKRGRQKLHPNYNKLNVEHSKVIDYAEPLRNIINLQTESLSNEPYWNDFECKKCWEVLPDLESLLNHEQIHPKYMWYNCRLCGKSFVKLNQLKKHFNHVHVRGKAVTEAVDKTFKCLECGNVTENYADHLQHVEKHKFKSVMKHLIEKKTDQLCLICLNKCTDLVELDKMVCIHGNCPELVGDKTLYTVLASTLPDHKSYKYQELHVPRKADIMTITQRKRKHTEIQNVPHIIPETQFILSLPKIISKDKFKTDDFYYYVFCEPHAEENHFMGTIDKNIETLNMISPRISEITDEEAMNCNSDDILNDDYPKSVFGDFIEDKIINTKETVETVTVAGKHNPVTEMVKDEADLYKTFKSSASNYRNQIELNANPGLVTDQIESVGLIIKGYATSMTVPDDEQNDEKQFLNIKKSIEVVRPEKNINDETENYEKDTIKYPNEYPTDLVKKEINTSSLDDSKSSIFQFSKPITLEFDFNKHHTDVTLTFQFCNPDYDDKNDLEIKDIEEIDIPEHEIVPIKVKTALSSIFTRTSMENENSENVTDVKIKPKIKDNDCKFCWLFKHSSKCEICKKPMNKNDEIIDESKQTIEKSTVIDNATKNITENLIDATTFYKENVELLRKSIKVEKQNNNTKIEEIWQCNVCLTTNNKDRSTCHCCESKKYIKNIDCKVTFGNMKTFFTPTHAPENIKESNIEKKSDISIKNSNPFIVINEETMMDTKWTVQENLKTQIGNMKDRSLTQSMDMDTDSVNYTFDIKHPINEDMDVEEETFTFNSAQEFDPKPTANFTSYFGTNIGANLQFNIGSTSSQTGHEKGQRKFVKTVRKMPKAFHK